MRYFDVIKAIKDTSLKHNLVNEFAEGDVYEWLNSKQHKYPCVVLTTNNITTGEDINTLNANLFYVDRLTDTDENKVKIQSLGVTVLQQILNKLNDPIFSWDSTTYTPFTEKFADLCAGVFVTFNIEYEAESLCDDGDFEIKTLNINKNGLYDVVGYDRAVVNIKGKEVEQTISAQLTYNGLEIGNNVIEADKDEFFKKVTINVPNKIDFDLGNLGVGGSRIPNFDNYNFVGWTSDMRYKFTDCRNITEIDLSNMKLQRKVNWDGCFQFCNKLKEIYFPQSPSELYIGDYMFYGCNNLSDATLDRFMNFVAPYTDTQYGNSFTKMFLGANLSEGYAVKLLKCLAGGVKNAYNFSGMFYNAHIGKNLNVNQYIHTSKGYTVNLEEMFYFCVDLENVRLIFNCGHITVNTKSMFHYCTHLKTVELNLITNNDSVYITDIEDMFNNCLKLETLNLLGKKLNINTPKYQYPTVFNKCRVIKTINIENPKLESTLKEILTASNIPDGQVTINVINQ